MKSVIRLFIVSKYRWIKVFRPIEWRVKTKPLNPWTFSSLQFFYVRANLFCFCVWTTASLLTHNWLITDLLLTLKINRHSSDCSFGWRFALSYASTFTFTFHCKQDIGWKPTKRWNFSPTKVPPQFPTCEDGQEIQHRQICRWRFPRNP